MNELSDKEFMILDVIASYNKPIGSGTVSMELSKGDKSLSEATVGRVMRTLDRRGYTEKIGFQGRIATCEGQEVLQKQRSHILKEEQLAKLLESSNIVGKQDLIDILIARRAIEREIVGLAVERINQKEIKRISDNIEKHSHKCQKNMSGAMEDREFHLLLSEIAQNRVLQTTLKFIINEGEVSPVLEFIRKEVGSILITDHKKILQALKNGSAKEAEEAMLTHINNLISDVNKYWSKIHFKNK